MFRSLFEKIRRIFVGLTTAKKTMINLILFGPPGSGKGTQAAMLVEEFNLLHISTGDLFRYEIGNKTPLGLKAQAFMDQGQLVPDEVTIGMLRNKVEANPDVAGYIFDGFPRTIPQCEALDELLASRNQEVSGLIALKVDDEEIVSRLLKRGEQSGRADDKDESVIRKRIEVYNAETAPVYSFYDSKSKSQEIEGVGSIEDIFTKLKTEVSKLA